jgi:hypothetical protein
MNILHYNNRTFPNEYGPEVTITVVLVQGEIDYACYMGIGSREFVARHGHKLSFKEAQFHFPSGLEKELYREG